MSESGIERLDAVPAKYRRFVPNAKPGLSISGEASDAAAAKALAEAAMDSGSAPELVEKAFDFDELDALVIEDAIAYRKSYPMPDYEGDEDGAALAEICRYYLETMGVRWRVERDGTLTDFPIRERRGE